VSAASSGKCIAAKSAELRFALRQNATLAGATKRAKRAGWIIETGCANTAPVVVL